MRVTVRCDFMTPSNGLPNQVWKSLRDPSDEEASYAPSLFAEQIQQALKIRFHSRRQRRPTSNVRRRGYVEDMKPVLHVDRENALFRFLHAKEPRDRKSTRLNSSHQIISYAVFC